MDIINKLFIGGGGLISCLVGGCVGSFIDQFSERPTYTIIGSLAGLVLGTATTYFFISESENIGERNDNDSDMANMTTPTRSAGEHYRGY